MADRPIEARAYGAHNTARPLSEFPAYAGVSLGMALWTQPAVSAYGADEALPLIDTIQYDWLSGNALASINVVVLYQTQLVSTWVMVCGQVNHLGM